LQLLKRFSLSLATQCKKSVVEMTSEKEVTIYDIARELEISASTVSRALKGNPVINRTTREKVTACAEQLGYRTNAFASNLRRKRTYTIGVIIPRLDSNFMSACLAGMEEVANEKGYNMIISQSHESVKKEAENAKTFFNNRVDGVIASLTVEESNLTYFDKFKEKKVPVVFFDRIPPETDDVCVLVDNFKASYTATRHLVQQGCRILVHVTLNSTSNVYADRERGFNVAAAESGCSASIIYTSGLHIESGKDAAFVISQMNPRPDGIFVSNDIAAAGCILELKSLGIQIPEEISIVGFNNDPVGLLISPKLSTIDYPGREAGIVAAKSLISILDDEIKPEKKILLETNLIIRESSKRR
jgi:LacI family transcriptional regulator